MKILVIPTSDWLRHPVPNRLAFIFERLAEDHEVYVCAFEHWKFRHNSPRDTSCYLLPMGDLPFRDPSSYYVGNLAAHASSLHRWIRNLGIDVILSANILPSFLATMVAGKVPIVFDYLDHLSESAAAYYPDAPFGQMISKAVSVLVKRNLVKASAVITVTPEFEGYLRSVGVDQVFVIPNGVNTSEIKPMDKAEAKKNLGLSGNVLGYVGSLEGWLDLENVVRCIPVLLKHYPKLKLLIVGPSLFSDYEVKLRALVEKIGVNDQVLFTGAVPYHEISRYISAMDICLNPRRPLLINRLTLGGKVFNYLACGKPVLSSNMPSLQRHFDEDSGLFIYRNNSEFIAQVHSILTSERPTDHYRKGVYRFDWDVLAEQYEKVLIQCVDEAAL